jgi:hypothetical protein
VTFRLIPVIASIAVASVHIALAQSGGVVVPRTIEAGAPFSIQSSGSGKATLYIVGLGQVLKRDVQLGEPIDFSAGSLYVAGHFVVLLATENSAQDGSLDVLPLPKPTDLSFLAKPSRLQVGLHDGITGSVYVFDVYHNLIDTSMPVSFELSGPSGVVQKHIVFTRNGAAWTAMDSSAQQGIDKFVARMGDISSTRVVGQVPGDPCGLKMSARQSGQQVYLATDQVRDCNGNVVPDGTIVTFTETYSGAQSTVDVPIKHGIAEAQMPAHTGAMISVASGVVLGNQIRWEK